QQNLSIHMNRKREAKPREHSRRIRAHRRMNEVPDLREGGNRRQLTADLGSIEAVHRTVEIDVLDAGQLWMKTRGKLDQRRDSALHSHLPLARRQNSGDDL